MNVYVIVSEDAAGARGRVLTARASKRAAERIAEQLARSSTQRGRRVYAEERERYWRRTYGKSYASSVDYDMTNAVAPVERY